MKNCQQCNKEFKTYPCRLKIGSGKFCSKNCLNKNKLGKLPWNLGLKGVMPKPWNKGKKMSLELRKKLSEIHFANPNRYWLGKNRPTGEKSANWKGGLTPRNKHYLSCPKYKKWRNSVFERDNFKCKIANLDCKGQLQAHHILRWADYPELRYEVNNGITLCHAHHPRKRAEEKRLSPYFMDLVSVSK